MKKIYAITIFMTLVIAIIPSYLADDPLTKNLIAGKNEDAGDITVWVETDNLHVKYETSGGWGITETHLHVTNILIENGRLKNTPDFPMTKKGNPKVGRFMKSSEHDPAVPFYEYIIPLDLFEGQTEELYIAAHAVLCKVSDIEDIESMLPNTITAISTHTYPPAPGGPTYFITELTGDAYLNGIYDGWCVDLSYNMHDGQSYLANVYSSYDDGLTEDIVNNPENLDLVNYILNQDFVGMPSICNGVFTWGDIQQAIWVLIEEKLSPSSPTGDYLECRVNEIVDNATTYGEDFIPICGDVLAIILDPINPEEGQGSIIELPIPCPDCETAWGNGNEFPGNNWAMWFTYPEID